MVGAIDPRAVYTLQQAAALSGFSVKTLRRAIEARELPYHKVRSRIRILGADLFAWLTGRGGRHETDGE